MTKVKQSKTMLSSGDTILVDENSKEAVLGYITNPNCSTCKHALHTDGIEDDLRWLDAPILCRRYPPVFIGRHKTYNSPFPTQHTDWTFPVLEGCDSCGEYEINPRIILL